MRVLNKSVRINEDFEPVLLITLELPLVLENGPESMHPVDFMAYFNQAIELYDEQERKKAQADD